jgi:mannitol operon repressor
MLLSTAEDLADFVSELQRESDRGLALVGAALIDEKLRETLRALFVEGDAAAKLLDVGNAPIGSLSTRTDACHALGLIDDYENAEIGLIRKVRNEFAHATHGLSFENARVRGLCSTLTSDLPKGSDYPLSDPRFRYTNAVVCIVLRLYHRPDWVALERRQAKTWVDPDATRWRSFETEPPPPGISPVVAIGKAKSVKPNQA